MTEEVHDFVERLATAISNDESSVRITPNDECYRFVSSSLYTLEQSKMFIEIKRWNLRITIKQFTISRTRRRRLDK